MYQSEIAELRRKTLGWKISTTKSLNKLSKILTKIGITDSEHAEEFIEDNLVGRKLEYQGLIWNPFPFYKNKFLTFTPFEDEGRKFYRVEEHIKD